MRDPGTEPLPMISGDAVELTKMIYAERAAHAAEVARLRAALEAIRDQFPQDLWGKLRVPEIAVAALAAPPTAAVEAIEAMRKALEGIKVVLSGAAPIDRGIALLHRDREEIERHLNALAAWKEATRG